MNLVGKILIVVILVMALFFMALTMGVYMTQRNWREVVMLDRDKAVAGKEIGLKWQLEDAKKANTDLTDRETKLKNELTTEKAAAQQQLVKLQNELAQAVKERKSIEAGRADLEKDKRDLASGINAAQKNATDYRQETEKTRTLLAQAQKDRDEHFKKVVELTDQINQLKNEMETLRKRSLDLAKDLAKIQEEARYFGLPAVDSDYKSKTPPSIHAHVTNVAGAGLLEIDLGSDAGLRVGHVLQVYRQGTYVGRVEVVKVDPTTSVCKIDTKFPQNSNVMVNDSVAAKIE